MQHDKSLEVERIEFFKRAHRELEAGVDPVLWESEFDHLWPGENGRFNQLDAFKAFQQENLHWAWPEPDEPTAA